jgi:hypothetical protein
MTRCFGSAEGQTRLEQPATGKLELSQRAVHWMRLAVGKHAGKTVFYLAKKMPIAIGIKEGVFLARTVGKA